MALAAAVLFAVSAVVAADVFVSVEPARVAQFRSFFAVLVLGLIAGRRGLLRVDGAWGGLMLLGVNLAVITITFYWAIERLGVGPGTTLQFTGPVLVMVWMRVVEKRRLPAVGWLAAVVAVLGTALMTRVWRGDLDVVGVAAGIGASLTFASYLILGERLGSRLPALTVMAYGFAFSALLWAAVVPPAVSDLTGGEWLSLGFIGVAGTAAPFLLEVSALRRADPGSVGVVATAEPVVGATVAWVVLSQALTPWQVAGGVLTAAAVASIHYSTTRRIPLPMPPA